MDSLTGNLQLALSHCDKRSGLLLCLRFLATFMVTIFVTCAMVLLVTTPQEQLQKKRNAYMLDFVRVQPNETVKKREPKPTKPAPPKAAPPPPMEMAVQTPQVKVQQVPLKAISNLPTMEMSSVGFNLGAVAEAEYLPIVKIAPTYPSRALRQGLQGHCTVEYTVTKLGATKDIRVVNDDCTHSLFRSVSVKAAQRFRYQPKVIEGKAIEVKGVRNQFVYQIAQ